MYKMRAEEKKKKKERKKERKKEIFVISSIVTGSHFLFSLKMVSKLWDSTIWA